MDCKNCGQTVKSIFCPHCGQSSNVREINFKNFLEELSEGVFQINRGLLYTIKELFLRPGHSIREYLQGKRKSYVRPIAYAFFLSTIYFLLSRWLESDTFMNQFVDGFTSGASGGAAAAERMLSWFANNYAYTTLLLLPLYALASFIAFRKSGYRYLEHFVLNAYITGQQAIFYLLASLLIAMFGNEDVFTTIIVMVSMMYTFFVFLQFFHQLKRIQVVLRTIVTYVLSLVLFGTVTILILLIFVK